MASSLLLTGVAGAQPVAAAGFTGIHNAAADHQCLDMPNGSTHRGTQAQVWTCNGHQQQFWAYYQNSSGGYQIQNLKSLLCLSVLNNSMSPGAHVIQWPCTFSATDPWENWAFFDTSGSNLYGLVNYGNSLVMVPSNCSTANGTKIVMGITDGCPHAQLWFSG
jgi:hypothetical protein